MATFGKSTDGTNVQTFSGDRIYICSGTPSTSGTVTAGNGRVRLTSAGTTTIAMVIFSDSAGVPNTFLARSDAVTVNWTTVTDTSFPFSGANQISITGSTPYWIGFWADDPGTPSYEYKRDNTVGLVHFAADVYGAGSPTSPFVSGGTANGPLNAVITYTESGGGSRRIFNIT